MYDVAIIGAGLCGLIAARKLARKGLKVLVIEADRIVGGRCSLASEVGSNAEWIDCRTDVTVLDLLKQYGYSYRPIENCAVWSFNNKERIIKGETPFKAEEQTEISRIVVVMDDDAKRFKHSTLSDRDATNISFLDVSFKSYVKHRLNVVSPVLLEFFFSMSIILFGANPTLISMVQVLHTINVSTVGDSRQFFFANCLSGRCSIVDPVHEPGLTGFNKLAHDLMDEMTSGDTCRKVDFLFETSVLNVVAARSVSQDFMRIIHDDDDTFEDVSMKYEDGSSTGAVHGVKHDTVEHKEIQRQIINVTVTLDLQSAKSMFSSVQCRSVICTVPLAHLTKLQFMPPLPPVLTHASQVCPIGVGQYRVYRIPVMASSIPTHIHHVISWPDANSDSATLKTVGHSVHSTWIRPTTAMVPVSCLESLDEMSLSTADSTEIFDEIDNRFYQPGHKKGKSNGKFVSSAFADEMDHDDEADMKAHEGLVESYLLSRLCPTESPDQYGSEPDTIDLTFTSTRMSYDEIDNVNRAQLDKSKIVELGSGALDWKSSGGKDVFGRTHELSCFNSLLLHDLRLHHPTIKLPVTGTLMHYNAGDLTTGGLISKKKGGVVVEDIPVAASATSLRSPIGKTASKTSNIAPQAGTFAIRSGTYLTYMQGCHSARNPWGDFVGTEPVAPAAVAGFPSFENSANSRWSPVKDRDRNRKGLMDRCVSSPLGRPPKPLDISIGSPLRGSLLGTRTPGTPGSPLPRSPASRTGTGNRAPGTPLGRGKAVPLGRASTPVSRPHTGHKDLFNADYYDETTCTLTPALSRASESLYTPNADYSKRGNTATAVLTPSERIGMLDMDNSESSIYKLMRNRSYYCPQYTFSDADYSLTLHHAADKPQDYPILPAIPPKQLSNEEMEEASLKALTKKSSMYIQDDCFSLSHRLIIAGADVWCQDDGGGRYCSSVEGALRSGLCAADALCTRLFFPPSTVYNPVRSAAAP